MCVTRLDLGISNRVYFLEGLLTSPVMNTRSVESVNVLATLCPTL